MGSAHSGRGEGGERQAAKGDINGFFEVNQEFHQALQELSGNRWLKQVIDDPDGSVIELAKVVAADPGIPVRFPVRTLVALPTLPFARSPASEARAASTFRASPSRIRCRSAAAHSACHSSAFLTGFLAAVRAGSLGSASLSGIAVPLRESHVAWASYENAAPLCSRNSRKS